jgi:hypothetical protein
VRENDKETVRETPARHEEVCEVRHGDSDTRANRIKVFKISTIEGVGEKWNLTVRQLESVRIKRGGYELYEFANL